MDGNFKTWLYVDNPAGHNSGFDINFASDLGNSHPYTVFYMAPVDLNLKRNNAKIHFRPAFKDKACNKVIYDTGFYDCELTSNQ